MRKKSLGGVRYARELSVELAAKEEGLAKDARYREDELEVRNVGPVRAKSARSPRVFVRLATHDSGSTWVMARGARAAIRSGEE